MILLLKFPSIHFWCSAIFFLLFLTNWFLFFYVDLIRYSIGAYRVTMAAVGNRASVCLAQFVLGGKRSIGPSSIKYALVSTSTPSFKPVPFTRRPKGGAPRR